MVELSIVLVILGLLVGGVLAGQSLIHAAELRAASTEYTSYQTALNSFREKYFALPGDMNNAQSFWGVLDATNSCIDMVPTDTSTCNGNANGRIDLALPFSREVFRFWQHLANAGLIEGTYTGASATAGNAWHAVIGTNTPRSRIPSGGWSVTSEYDADVNGGWYAEMFRPANATHWFILGGANGGLTTGQIFRAEDGWNIDSKIDDGKPGQGRVTTRANWTCTTTAIANTAEYIVSAPSPTCYMIFAM